MNELVNMSQEQTMGTSEIAKLIGKRHSDIQKSYLRLVEGSVLGGTPVSHPYKRRNKR